MESEKKRTQTDELLDAELDDVELQLTDELEELLGSDAAGDCPMLNDMQPPTSVIALAAQAAAKIIMAFERGYRMGGD